MWTGKLLREVNVHQERAGRTPQEHCLAAAANQNTHLTHSNGQSKQHNGRVLDRKNPGSDIQNKYTAEHGRLRRESDQISQWLQKWTGLVLEKAAVF